MREPLYDPARALEDVALMPGVRPVRLHRIALPLFAVEIDSVIEARQAYELLDRFVGRAIAEARLDTVPGIAGFLGLDEAMVDRVLRFLGGIGHVVSRPDGTVALTDLGARSVRDGARYVPKRDRQKLYFDGVLGDPLPAAYYGRKVIKWDTTQALEQKWYHRMSHACDFRTDALHHLASRPDRQDFNVPDELREVTSHSTGLAYLPCYVIRTQTNGGPSALTYSAVADTCDQHLQRICLNWTALTTTLDAGDTDDVRAEFEDWLAERDIDPAHLGWTTGETLRLTLPASRFAIRPAPGSPKGTFALTRVGSYVTPRSHVLQLWCDDEDLRREAALERALTRVTASRTIEAAEAEAFLSRLSTQLATAITLDDLHAHAHKTGQGPLPL